MLSEEYNTYSENIKSLVTELHQFVQLDFKKRWGSSRNEMKKEYLYAEALDPLFSRHATEDTWKKLEEDMVADAMFRRSSELKNQKEKTIDITDCIDDVSSDDSDDGDYFSHHENAIKKLKLELMVNTEENNENIHDEILNKDKDFIQRQIRNELINYRYGLESYIKDKMGKMYNVLSYHKDHTHIQPYISKYSSRIFCIQATSAASERVFSSMGLIVSNKRHRLNVNTLITLMYLKVNIHVVKNILFKF